MLTLKSRKPLVYKVISPITNFYRTSGKDFWITRNNIEAPYIKRPENYGSLLNFKGPSQDFFNYFLEAKREKGSQWASASGFATSYATQLEFAPNDNINFSLYYQHLNEDGLSLIHI